MGFDASTARQFELIEELAAVVEAASVQWWLFGGWAIDFHAGKVTRPHADIECFVAEADALAARTALLAAGYVAPAALHGDEGQPFLKSGQQVGAWYVRFDDGENGRMVGRWAGWPLPPDTFRVTVRRIGRVVAPVISVAGLIEMKAGFAKQPHGAPLRDKDEADLTRLRELLDLRLPSERDC